MKRSSTAILLIEIMALAVLSTAGIIAANDELTCKQIVKVSARENCPPN